MESVFLTKLREDKDLFDKHPLCSKDEHIKRLYLSMLYACSVCDGDMTEEEMLFLEKLGRSGGISKDEIIKAQFTDLNSLIQDFKYDFINDNILCTFICDITLLSYIDDEINDNEIGFICNLAEAIELDERFFEYFFHMAQWILNEDEEKYLLAVLSRPKDVDFKYFRFYFDNYGENGFSNDYILEVLENKKMLEEVKDKLIKMKNMKLSTGEIALYLNDEIFDSLDDDISDFEDLCREITNKTGEYLTVTDDDVYCEMLEDLTDIHQQCVNLFADSARIVIEGSSDTINIDKTVNEMVGSIDSAIRYLDELTINK